MSRRRQLPQKNLRRIATDCVIVIRKAPKTEAARRLFLSKGDIFVACCFHCVSRHVVSHGSHVNQSCFRCALLDEGMCCPTSRQPSLSNDSCGLMKSRTMFSVPGSMVTDGVIAQLRLEEITIVAHTTRNVRIPSLDATSESRRTSSSNASRPGRYRRTSSTQSLRRRQVRSG